MADSTSSMPVGATGAGGGNMLRITGLNTGLDIDAMVKKMLTADQTKVDQAKQQQQLVQWRQEAYQSIIKDVKDLQSTYFDITKSASYLLSSGSYNNMVAVSDSPSDIYATTNSNAVAGNYKVLVKQLARSAAVAGSDIVKTSSGANASTSTKLTDIDSSLSGEITLQLKYNGNEKTITLNNSGNATVKDLIDKIKNDTNGAVTAKLDDLTGKFVIQTSDTGAQSTLEIESSGSSSKLLEKFNLTSPDKIEGQNAIVGIKEPGSDSYVKTEQKSNSFTINGVNYNIYSTTPNTDIDTSDPTKLVGDNPIGISVNQDTSKMHDLITSFIDKYNNLVGEIQDKLSEKKDYDYSPLTDSQKSQMSDTDITNWENKAKEGILENDDNLQQLLDDLTSAFNTPVVDENGKSVSTVYFGSIGSNAIGIDTSNDYTQGGKLSITDEQQFTDALTNHADDVMKLFTTTSDSTNPTDKFNQSGIFERIDDILNKNVGIIGSTFNEGILTKYANVQDDHTVTGGGGTGTLPDQIYQKQLLVNTLTGRMDDDQTKYYNQFTQLEVAMEQLNAQQSTLSMYLS
ncbi:flagellar filament capping protein FliD [uncultured Clostridium sp.]|uniref:flagellar filament capping protein FliD n=1 Tax=uncultured Clostridium sp. TaxID=59620 RepID=UPI0025E76A60|nr:flagellar filament capping protein FliD [uncultured Clostridium sp.]